MMGFLKSIWGYIAAGAIALGGILVALFEKKSADAEVAKSDAQVAEGNAAASQAGLDNVQNAEAAKADAQAVPDTNLAQAAKDAGIARS